MTFNEWWDAANPSKHAPNLCEDGVQELREMCKNFWETGEYMEYHRWTMLVRRVLVDYRLTNPAGAAVVDEVVRRILDLVARRGE
jgi:hypothetical protein